MRSSHLHIEGTGPTLAGVLRLPDVSKPPYPTIVQAPGWLGVAETESYVPYHQAFTAAGFAVLVIDYRGFGASEGDPTLLDPRLQVHDWLRAVRWAVHNDDLDGQRIGIFGSGGTGGGNAVAVAAAAPGIRAVVAQVPIADGKDWMRRMRTPDEWSLFMERLSADRRRRARGAPSELVLARGELSLSAGDRHGWKSDVDAVALKRVRIASAEAILAYRPLDVASRVRRLMIVAVDGDDVTPTDHAVRLYEAASSPKRLVLQRGTTHYRAYRDHREVVVPMMVEWFQQHIMGTAPPDLPSEEVVIVGDPA